jgi:hypothetical protein
LFLAYTGASNVVVGNVAADHYDESFTWTQTTPASGSGTFDTEFSGSGNHVWGSASGAYIDGYCGRQIEEFRGREFRGHTLNSTLRRSATPPLRVRRACGIGSATA